MRWVIGGQVFESIDSRYKSKWTLHSYYRPKKVSIHLADRFLVMIESHLNSVILVVVEIYIYGFSDMIRVLSRLSRNFQVSV